MPDENGLLTIDEAAQLLRVSPRWLRDSECPRIRLGRLVRFEPGQVLAFARARSTPRIALEKSA